MLVDSDCRGLRAVQVDVEFRQTVCGQTEMEGELTVKVSGELWSWFLQRDVDHRVRG